MKKVHLHMLAAGLVCICLHAAKAQFIGPYLLPPAPVLNSLIITDIDNNPAPEFLIGRADPVVSVGWYANNGIGQFDSLQALTADPEGYDQVITGDLDQDNDEDLILRKGNLILWRANDGAWNFGDTMEIGSASLLYQAIDLTGDGYPEITATDGSNPFWFRNDGLGTLGQKAYFDIIANDFKPFFADLNNDGDPDLIRLDEGNGGIFWYKNYGDGVFGAKTFIGSSLYSEEISLLDMDGDGDLDILAANPGGVRWLANLGGGVFNSSSQIIESIPFFIPMAVAADFDRDGDNDVFAAALSDPVLNEPERGHFRYYENLGNGLFAAPDSFGMAAGVQKLLVDDLDDDGDLDVAFRTDSAVGWWENLFNPIMIGGACFWDKNENKVWDAGEPSANGIRLQLEPTNLVTYTQSGDGFRFFVDTGDYLLSYAQNACWHRFSRIPRQYERFAPDGLSVRFYPNQWQQICAPRHLGASCTM